MSRQVRIIISDEVWADVSSAAARRRMDRGALIDELLRKALGSETPEAVPAGHLPKPPAEPADAALPYRPVPKPRKRG